MLQKQSLRLGRLIKKAMRLRGGGSALPGLVVERLAPHFLRHALSDLPYGVVVVSGTNGKTTTTKIVAELLTASGLKVFTNRTGSNFTRGIVASLLDKVDEDGTLHDDIAVVELDEAHAVHFVRQVSPRYTLILNVLRDQLDRFGEIDHTALLLRSVVKETTEAVVLNDDDQLTRAMSDEVPQGVSTNYFGVAASLTSLFPSDAQLHHRETTEVSAPPQPDKPAATVTLEKLKAQRATFAFDGVKAPAVTLKLKGVYNVQNATAALALTKVILNDKFDTKKSLKILEEVRPAFGRGEAVTIDGSPLEIILVKNPSGFRLSLKSYEHTSKVSTMIAINDHYADGRDMSWLWDVDFGCFQENGVSFVSGTRAYDMALRLQYDDITVGRIVPDIPTALDEFLTSSSGPKRIFCTYTTMLAFRRELGKRYEVEAVE